MCRAECSLWGGLRITGRHQQHRANHHGKGDKQHGNREAKKPKADKKAAPATTAFLKPQPEARKPAAKPAK